MPASAQAMSQGEDTIDGARSRAGLTQHLAEAREVLAGRQLAFPLTAGFTWQEMGFLARVEPPAQGRAELSLSGEIGLLPYTIEDAGARRAALIGLRDLNREGRELWQARPDGRITMLSRTVFEAPHERTQILTAIALVLLSLKPHLDLLAPLLHPSEGPRQHAALAHAV